MRKTTLGQILINSALPPELRDYNRVLTKKGSEELMKQLAADHPEKYRLVAKRLMDVGRDAAFSTGGQSFGLRSLRAMPAATKMRAEFREQLAQIMQDPKLDDDGKSKALVTAARAKYAELVPQVYEEARAAGNPLADQVESGARGNPSQLNSLLGADMMYADNWGDDVPIPVLRSYSQGLRPAEYFAASYGTRKGVVDLKRATADAGFAAKQLIQAAHRLLVSADDDDEPYDDANPRGLPVDTLDNDNAGSLLGHAAGGYARNTLLTPKILKDLAARGVDQILVRSPTVGGPADGGVYARDAGQREKGRIAPIGDFVGHAAAQAIAEPLTQSQLSSKHTAGVAGAGSKAIGGFKYINSLIQVPKTFKGGAAHAQLDGAVTDIMAAPHGGNWVTVGNERHYVAPNYELQVKVGDKVEAGDVLSDGVPNPAEIVRFKGIGEGRRYFVESFRKALNDSGVSNNRRNIELLGRGLINHVKLTQEVGDYMPDDVVPYTALERGWQPREGFKTMKPSTAVGRYLERPVLHYSVGTKIQPSMLPHLTKFGVQQVDVHDDEPPFQPVMIRAMENVHHDPDWLTRMLGSYQHKSLLKGVHRGATSDAAGTSFVAPLAQAKDFGLTGLTQGWKQDFKQQNTGTKLQ